MSNDKNTNSIFPAPVRAKIIYWLLGLLGAGILSWVTLFSEKNFFTETQGAVLEKMVHNIEHNYYPKEEAEELEDRVLIIENNMMHQTRQFKTITATLERIEGKL